MADDGGVGARGHGKRGGPRRKKDRVEQVDHPAHYGGADNPYEAVKVIEAWSLGFNLGNTVKYIARAGKKGELLQDLCKALWYLRREVENEEKRCGLRS